MVNHLLAEFQQAPKIGVAYIYCNYQRHVEQEATDVLSSLLKQLAQTRSPLPRSVQELYKLHDRFRTHSTLEQISETLRLVAGEFSKVFIVIDALDECATSENTRATILDGILRLQKHATVNILATSRPNEEISRHFSGSVTKDISAAETDIRVYLNRQITLNKSLVIDDALSAEVSDKIITAANGM